MERYRKLKSGNWNLQKYDYTDENGKRHNKSFTAPTKTEIKKMVADWQINRRNERTCAVVLSDAFRGYIDLKKNVLSPSTIRSYEGILRNHISGTAFGRLPVEEVNNRNAQKFISDISETHSPKTVRNIYGLLSAVIATYSPDMRLTITLPQKTKPSLYVPNSDDIRAVLDAIRINGDRNTEIAVLLALLIPARRGEVCALEYSDIKGNFVTINKSMVMTPERAWKVKAPKSYGGYREVEVPQFVIDLIGTGAGRIVNITPDTLTSNFEKYIRIAGVQPFRFHDLRHYGASMLLTIMSQRYVQDRGGWQSNQTMNNIYNNVIDLEKKKQTKEALKIFEKFANVR